MTEFVVLVNEQDEVQGTMEKLEAHEKGLLHRAISVLIYNAKGEMLIQQRSEMKYHWPLIWANACCSHPREHESYSDAAHRRVFEELGIRVPLSKKFDFIYKATDKTTGLIEHELDYVFEGFYDGSIPFNIEEVADIQWISIENLKKDILENEEMYAFWFREIMKQL
jgi:isopentenyl-diphosphate delta-isomerase